LNGRERWHATNNYEPFDRPFRWEMHPYPEAVRRWEREGMPPDEYLENLVGYDRFERAPISAAPCPAFVREDLEYQDDYIIYRDGDGVIKKIRRDATPPAMPQYVRYPIQTRGDWNEFKKRLDPNSPRRFPLWWDSLKKMYENRDFPLGIHAGSMFGRLRNWMGIERISTALYDDPKWIQEMMDYMADFFYAIVEKVVFDIQFDYALLWEDMAYKTASIISPRHFRDFMMAGYKKITELLHKAGITIIALDSDGNVEELIPLWLECGINFIYPMEVAAGMDVVALRRKFGRDLRMGGGMDKRILARGDKRDIEKMVMRTRHLMLEGGYVPGVDHAIPHDVSWTSFKYYRDLVNQIHH